MTCDQAIELLPWLLNGTLEAQERAEVRQHLATCERCREALRGTREAWQIFDQHLPTEFLVALAWGEERAGLDQTAAEAHLAFCPQCAAEMELVQTSQRLEGNNGIAVFPVPAPKRSTEGEFRTWRAAALAAGLAGVVAAAGWFNSSQEARLLNAQLAERKPVEAPATRPTAPAPVPAIPTPDSSADRKLAEMAADLQKMEQIANETEARAEQLAQVLQAQAEPQLNVQSPTLRPVFDERSTAPEQDAAAVVTAGQPAPLFLPAGPEDQSPLREIEILAPSGAVFWKSSGLRRSQQDDYSLLLPANFFKKPGVYTVQLYSRADGKRVPREKYLLRVR